MTYFKFLFLIGCLFWCIQKGYGQQYSQKEILRGTLSELRSCYDVLRYDLSLKVIPEKKWIEGSNTITFKAVKNFKKMQIDLFANMEILGIWYQNKKLSFKREEDAVFIDFLKEVSIHTEHTLRIDYQGNPTVAINAPWDGGFTWTKNQQDKPWIAVSCEGIGASLWYPNKDHLSDEPDRGASIICQVPEGLQCISNGELKNTQKLKNGFHQFTWEVSYPINNYNITLNIGDYTHFSDTYTSADGQKLSLDYYVMPYNLDKAKKQFEQVKPMLACHEKLFGKYPFWKDGFALVETPYLGMEHQGAIAYGNKYKNGYAGRDLSNSGVGLLFDFIIIHESGHEYWGNSVSCQDRAEMWIHEAFTTYSEVLYVECLLGKEKADTYVNGYKNLVKNDMPMLGQLGVNAETSGDIYFKGALMLNTLRHAIDNDSLWFDLLYKMAHHFKFKTTNTQEIIEFINQKTQQNWSAFFNEYLKYTTIPVLEIKKENNQTWLRWKAQENTFSMPLKIFTTGSGFIKKNITTQWQAIDLPSGYQVSRHLYYIDVKEVN